MEDDSPVPIMISTVSDGEALSKATVDEWQDDRISIFGVKREKNGGYDFEDRTNIVDYMTVVSGGGLVSSLSVYSDEVAKIPYYYQEGRIYDFFGYHIGNASVKALNLGNDECSVDVEISGSDDLMYASVDLQKDLEASDATDITVNDLYSARAARRGVQPTLVFRHALSRFIFVVRGQGDKYDKLEIVGLEVQARNSGRLTFKGAALGFTADAASEPVTLRLKDAEDRELAIQDVVPNTESMPLGGEGASIIIPSGEDSLKVSLKCRIKEDLEPVEYDFTLAATAFVNHSEVSDVFKPGSSYKIYMTVYGPEEIIVKGIVDGWTNAGDFEINPDDYEGIVVGPDDDINVDGTHVGDYEDGGHLGDIEE